MSPRGTATLQSVCERAGLPEVPPEDGLSKRQRVLASFSELPDAALPTFATALLASPSDLQDRLGELA